MLQKNILESLCREMKKSLGPILSTAEFLKQKNLSQEEQNDLQTLQSSAENLLNIANNILDTPSFEKIPFSLRGVFGKVLPKLKKIADQKQITFSFQIPAELPDSLLGSPTHFRQILEDLFGEFIEAIPPHVREISGGLRARATSKTQIRFELYLEKTKSKQAWPPASTLKSLLALQTLIKMSGKSHQTPQRFYFSIPFSLNLKPLTLASPQAGTISLEKRRALIVDQDLASQSLLSGFLSSLSMVTESVSSGQEALKLLKKKNRKKTYAVIFIGKDLSDQTGFSFAKALGKNRLKTPLVMIAQHAERGDAAQCRETGIRAYFTHPIQAVELWEMLQNVLTNPHRNSFDLITRHSLREEDRKLRILITEGKRKDKNVIPFLQYQGHQITIAPNTQAILSALGKQAYDLFLLDLHTPGVDPFLTISKIRKMEKTKGGHVHVIGVTDELKPQEGEEALQAGLDECLVYPHQQRPEGLLKMIERFSG